MTRWLVGMAVVIGLAAAAHAGPITVDGDLSDWGLTIADNNGSNINAGGYSYGKPAWVYDFMSEDTEDRYNNYQVGPEWGGQNYDAEFLGVASHDGKIFLALVSGQRPDNGASLWAPGDIRIETTNHRYGIEVGGGAAKSGGAGIAEGAPGAFYYLNSNGYTVSPFVDETNAFLAGTLVEDATFWNDPINPHLPTQVEQVLAGTNLGLTDYFFSLNSISTQHSLIELSFDASLLDGDIKSIHWRPSCGNDELDIVFEAPFRPQSVPLPRGAVLGFAGLGFLGLLGYRRRLRTRREPV